MQSGVNSAAVERGAGQRCQAEQVQHTDTSWQGTSLWKDEDGNNDDDETRENRTKTTIGAHRLPASAVSAYSHNGVSAKSQSIREAKQNSMENPEEERRAKEELGERYGRSTSSMRT